MRETEFLVELLLHVVIRVPLTRDIRKELTFLLVYKGHSLILFRIFTFSRRPQV